MITESEHTLIVPRRTVPVPTSVSAEAQAYLAATTLSSGPYPAIGDPAGWQEYITSMDGKLLAHLRNLDVTGARAERVAIDGRCFGYAIDPPNATPGDRRAYLDIHGGALVLGGGDCCRLTGVVSAIRYGLPTLTVDYRMPPEHPYPAGLDDCLAAYRALLDIREPSEIVIGGTSSGGNLAAALVLRARDEGLPLPAALFLLTAQLDLTESGDSFRTNLGVDTVLRQSMMPVNVLYAGGHDLAHPYLSPIFGDFGSGFPPTFIASGTRDLFLSNMVRMHRSLRQADIHAELHVIEGAPHGLLPGTPEAARLVESVRAFIDRCCPSSSAKVPKYVALTRIRSGYSL